MSVGLISSLMPQRPSWSTHPHSQPVVGAGLSLASGAGLSLASSAGFLCVSLASGEDSRGRLVVMVDIAARGPSRARVLYMKLQRHDSQRLA